MPTYTTGYQNNQRLRVVVDVTTNHSSNSSTVRVRHYQDRSSGYIASDSWEMFTSLDGSTLHNSTQYRSINSTTLISDNTRTISHANSGQRTVRVIARSWTHATSLFRQEIDQTITLTTIDTKPGALGAPSLSYSGGVITVTAPVASAPAPITNYQIRRRHRRGSESWSSWTNLTISPSRSEQVSPTNEYDYQFQARASTSGGWGPWGSTASFLRPSAPDAPTASLSGNSVTVTAPSVSGASRYQNRYRRRAKGGAWNSWIAFPESSSRVDSAPADHTDDMQFQSRVENANGWSMWGSTRSFTRPNAPGAPSVSRSGQVVTVTAPSVAGADEYQNRRRIDSGDGWSGWADLPEGRVATVTLDPDDILEVRSRVSNSTGWGPWGTVRTYAMPSTPGTPSSVTVSTDVRDLTATWSQPGSGGDAITRYETQIRDLTTGGGWTDLRDTGLTRSVTYSGLQPGSEYEVQVRAVNSVGSGGWRVSTPIRINAYGNRRTSTGWVPVSHAYRRTSSGWVPISRIRRWTGTTWVDVT